MQLYKFQSWELIYLKNFKELKKKNVSYNDMQINVKKKYSEQLLKFISKLLLLGLINSENILSLKKIFVITISQ